jgi:mono/diheme cytochrome c family protein
VIADAFAANFPLGKLDQPLAAQVVQLIAWSAGNGPAARDTVLAAARRHDNAFSRYIASSLAAVAAPAEAPVLQFPPDAEVHLRGAQVYNSTCVACHGIDGKGVPDVFPPLAGSEWITGPADVPVRIMLNGLVGPITVDGAKYNSVMPPLPQLSPAEMADVLTYVRQSFGNDASPVTNDEVIASRRTHWQRKEFWTAEELAAPE